MKCLSLNGFEIDASVDEQEEAILKVALGGLKRDESTDWLCNHIIKKKAD